MIRPSSMILLASLVASTKGDVQCPVCWQTAVENFCTINSCEHKVCIMCITRILCSINPTCPTCTVRIGKVTGTKAYEAELASFKEAVVNNEVTFKRIIARYYLLPPWQVADEIMLDGIGAIVNGYVAVYWDAAIQRIRSNVNGYTFVEDVKERSKFFCVHFDDEEREVIILHQYYTRNGFFAPGEFLRRVDAYE